MNTLSKFKNFGLSVSAIAVVGNKYSSFPKHYTGWFTSLSFSLRNKTVSGAMGSDGKVRMGSLGFGITTSMLSLELSQTYYWRISKQSSLADIFNPLKSIVANKVNWLALFYYLVL